MLLGTDIQAVLTTLAALDVEVIGLNCSTGPGGHARRDPLPRRDLARCRSTASPTPACRCRAPTARRSSRGSPSRWPRRSGEFVERYGVGIVGGCCGTTPEHIARDPRAGRTAACRRAPRAPATDGLEHDDRHPAGAGAAPDAGRRARQLAGLAHGEGAAARRRLRRPRPGRRGPGRPAAPTCSTSASRSPSARTRTPRWARSSSGSR